MIEIAQPLKRLLPVRARRFLKSKYTEASNHLYLRQLEKNCIAEQPVNLTRLQYFRSEVFPNSGPIPWLDRPNAKSQISERLRSNEIDSHQKQQCQFWEQNGYVVLKGVFNSQTLDPIWRQYETDLAQGLIPKSPDSIEEGDPYPGRHLNLHHTTPSIRQLVSHPQIMETLKLLLGEVTVPFQTMNFSKGSQQRAHSDAIHMTTYPLGYMAAAWIAFEDIHPDSGPLEYYPGSHKLPYLLCNETGIAPGAFQKSGYTEYAQKYEPAIQAQIDKHHLKAEKFLPKKGDVLLWHSNLIHGGTKRNELQRSRKSIVCHYFSEKVVTYHDLSGNFAKIL